MTEGEFIRFYKKKNYSRNHKEVKEKIDLFWNVLLKALDREKKITFKGWGSFEKKEVKPRKIITPRMERAAYTEPKEVVRFKAGIELVKAIEGDKNE